MTVTASVPPLALTKPAFLAEAKAINSVLRELTPGELQELMNISPKLADENWARNQRWSSSSTSSESLPALYAFIGEVYRGLDAGSLSLPAVEYLQKHHRILSGLYGLLRPMDVIMPYRLEMGRPLALDSAKDLYEFWREKLTSALNRMTKNSGFILNLSSHEYSRAIDWKKIKTPAYTVEFLEASGRAKPRSIVVYLKHARGLMTRYCAENNIQTLEGVKSFHAENYLFSEELSEGYKLVFLR